VRHCRGSVRVCRSQRIECMDQRRVTKPACPKYCVRCVRYECQRRVPKPAGLESVRHLDDQTMMRSFACITH